MRPAAAGRRNPAWPALLASLMIGLAAVRAHAGVVVISPKEQHPSMAPLAGDSHIQPVQSAKWIGVCGAILLFLRRYSLRR